MSRVKEFLLFVGFVLAFSTPLAGQQSVKGLRLPHVGYIYPAGGQAGTEFDVTIGGQYLDGITEVLVSRLDPTDGQKGVLPQASFVKLSKPLTQQQVNDLSQKLKDIQSRVREEMRHRRLGSGQYWELFVKFAAEAGITEEMLKEIEEFRKTRNDPKRQPAPQIAERATIHMLLPKETEPGMYLIRVRCRAAVSEPLRFHVAPWQEVLETEPNDHGAVHTVAERPPLVINGQIMSGDVDRFQISAKKGQHLVVAVLARELIPYLADGVPGWFQATLRVVDSSGREIAYVDDFWFRPDPVLAFEVPQDGQYTIEIQDAIYRGRQDFVYRIVVGEIPYVTSIFPLGGRIGEARRVTLSGWNLPQREWSLPPLKGELGTRHILLPDWIAMPRSVPFVVSKWPEVLEREPNDSQEVAQKVDTGVVVNGRVDKPGDKDVFVIEGQAGQMIVAEVAARRLYSPLDSIVRIIDENGQIVALNDDTEDKSAGMLTHYADSCVQAKLPRTGKYFIALTDAQHQGGLEFAYRLRISLPHPDFELRVVPSMPNAVTGAVIPVDVYAIRRDGFDGDIYLDLVDAPEGMRLSGNWIPSGQDHATITMSLPSSRETGIVKLTLVGKAVAGGKEIVRKAIAADDMMQAFYYHHLVPAGDWAVNVTSRSRYGVAWVIPPEKAMTIPIKDKAEIRLPWIGSSGTTVRLELSNPPEGLSVADVVRDSSGVRVVLTVDKEKIKPGTKGNLVFQVYNETQRRGLIATSTQTVRSLAGWLPAVPFVVTEAETAQR
ncbi:MAG: PPC domain-containing protein [Thermogutta sp.]